MSALLTPRRPNGALGLSQREKERILQLYDLELESRLKDLHADLAAKLENPRMYADNQTTRLPLSARSVSLLVFGDKYNGDITTLVRGMASLNVLQNNPAPPAVGKRKRVEGNDDKDDQGTRKAKTARQAPDSPQKPLPARTAHGTPGPRARGSGMTASTSASGTIASSSRSLVSRAPQIPGTTHSRSQSQSQPFPFPHSSSTFDPHTKDPLPTYPRPMRPDEVILSENGSPVANPFSARSTSYGSATGALGLGLAPGAGMRDIEREVARSRIGIAAVAARDSSSTTGTRSSQATMVERDGSLGGGFGLMGGGAGAGSTGSLSAKGAGNPMGAGLMLQVKTATGSLVSFDPLLTLPEDLEARDDLPKEDKKAIANAMLQFASTLKSWGSLASS